MEDCDLAINILAFAVFHHVLSGALCPVDHMIKHAPLTDEFINLFRKTRGAAARLYGDQDLNWFHVNL